MSDYYRRQGIDPEPSWASWKRTAIIATAAPPPAAEPRRNRIRKTPLEAPAVFLFFDRQSRRASNTWFTRSSSS